MSAMGFLRRISLVSVGLAGVWQIALASDSDSGTLTPAQAEVCLPGPKIIEIGFANSDFGSYSPTGLTGGKTVELLEDVRFNACGGPNESLFYVTGFTSSPGSSWLISVTCGGVEKLASAGSFSYSNGAAEWGWSSIFGFSENDQVSCTIVHN